MIILGAKLFLDDALPELLEILQRFEFSGYSHVFFP
jgi:hypothetical protein